MKKTATKKTAKTALMTKKSRKANENPEKLGVKSKSQEKKSKAPNLFAKGKKAVQNEDDIAKRGSPVTRRDAVRAKAVEAYGRRP